MKAFILMLVAVASFTACRREHENGGLDAVGASSVDNYSTTDKQSPDTNSSSQGSRGSGASSGIVPPATSGGSMSRVNTNK